MKDKLMELLSRKFILAVVILVAGFVFVLVGRIDYNLFLDLAKWILGIYVVGNVGTKLSGVVKK